MKKRRFKIKHETHKTINKNMKTLNKNTKCAKCKSNHNFIMTKCENINMKKIKQSYGARSYFKVVLNILKIMGGLVYLYPFGDLIQGSFYGCFHMCTIQKHS